MGQDLRATWDAARPADRADHDAAERPHGRIPATPAPPRGDPLADHHGPARPPRRKRLLLAAVAAAVLGAGGAYGWRYWTEGRFLETTDDAYLEADAVTISPRVGGYVAAVEVGDNRPVRAGDVLLRIDDADYRAALAEARAAVAAAEAEIATLDARTALERASVEQRAADVAAAGAALTLARQDRERYDRLAMTSAGTVQRAQQADYALQDRQAALAKGRAALNAAERQVEATEARRQQAAAGLARARAALTRAGLALSWTVVTAPVDGVVGDRGVRVGEVVQPGARLMQVVPVGRALYVVANLKETQLEHVAPGESVSVAVDGFPHHTFRGRVDSLAPGSGAEFAILPPENATGNFTKIVQRVPVKVALDPDDPLLGRLRPGLSVEASIDTRTGPAAGGREGAG